jgi:hypothetical protein
VDQEDLKDLRTSQNLRQMSKLINEDWEHASRAAEEGFDALHQQYIMEAEWQEWQYLEDQKKKKPALIIVEKPLRDENAHKPSSVQRTHQEGL